jgi:hypothetical protein
MLNVVGMMEGVTTIPTMTEEDGTTTGDALIMMMTIIRPVIQIGRTTIALIMVGTLGGRFFLIGNDMGKDASSQDKRGLQWVCLKR